MLKVPQQEMIGTVRDRTSTTARGTWMKAEEPPSDAVMRVSVSRTSWILRPRGRVEKRTGRREKKEKMERKGRKNATLKTVKKESCQMKMKTILSCGKNPRLSAGSSTRASAHGALTAASSTQAYQTRATITCLHQPSHRTPTTKKRTVPRESGLEKSGDLFLSLRHLSRLGNGDCAMPKR